jgi:hypothetical protein
MVGVGSAPLASGAGETLRNVRYLDEEATASFCLVV